MELVGSGWLALQTEAAAGSLEDRRLPDTSQGTGHWGDVATPHAQGRKLRCSECGARYFIELDADVIGPLRALLMQGHPARDLRRRACGYDVIKVGGGKGGKPPTFVIEVDGLISLLDQEWVAYHRKKQPDTQIAATILRWKEWARFVGARQPKCVPLPPALKSMPAVDPAPPPVECLLPPSIVLAEHVLDGVDDDFLPAMSGDDLDFCFTREREAGVPVRGDFRAVPPPKRIKQEAPPVVESRALGSLELRNELKAAHIAALNAADADGADQQYRPPESATLDQEQLEQLSRMVQALSLEKSTAIEAVLDPPPAAATAVSAVCEVPSGGAEEQRLVQQMLSLCAVGEAPSHHAEDADGFWALACLRARDCDAAAGALLYTRYMRWRVDNLISTLGQASNPAMQDWLRCRLMFWTGQRDMQGRFILHFRPGILRVDESGLMGVGDCLFSPDELVRGLHLVLASLLHAHPESRSCGILIIDDAKGVTLKSAMTWRMHSSGEFSDDLRRRWVSAMFHILPVTIKELRIVSAPWFARIIARNLGEWSNARVIAQSLNQLHADMGGTGMLCEGEAGGTFKFDHAAWMASVVSMGGTADHGAFDVADVLSGWCQPWQAGLGC